MTLKSKTPSMSLAANLGGANGEDGIGGGLGRLAVGHPAQPLKPQHPSPGEFRAVFQSPLSFSQGCTVEQVSGSIHPRTRAWNLQGFTLPQIYDCRQLRCGVRSLSLSCTGIPPNHLRGSHAREAPDPQQELHLPGPGPFKRGRWPWGTAPSAHWESQAQPWVFLSLVRRNQGQGTG